MPDPVAKEIPAAISTEMVTEIWLTLEELVGLGVARTMIHRRMADGGWVWRKGEGGRELLLDSLPDEMKKLVRGKNSSCRNGELPGSVPADLAYQEAGRRWELLQQWEKLSSRQRRGAEGSAILQAWTDAPAKLVARCPSLAVIQRKESLDRILRKVRAAFSRGENGALLTLGRLVPRAGCHRDQALPEEARAHILKLYLKERARTVAQVQRAFEPEAKRRGWPLVSYDTIRRLIRGAPSDVVVLARRGVREYRNKAAPFIPRSFEDLAAGDVLCGDHHQFDFFVRCERTGKLFRPWLTGWQDHRSRALPGWHICEKPSSLTIMAAFAAAVKPKNRIEYELFCGVPKGIYIDNGQDYRCQALEGPPQVIKVGLSSRDASMIRGLFPQLFIDVTHAQPYNPKAKIIERLFGTIASDFSSAIPGYCGSDTKDRATDIFKELVRQHKEWLAGKRAETPFLTMAEVIELFEAWLFKYHTRAHDSLSTGGRSLSPVDVYRLYGKAPGLVDDRTLELLLMERKQRTIQKNGIELQRGNWYFHEDLVVRVSQKVEVRLDPQEAGRVYVFDLRGKFICEAIHLGRLRAGATPEEVAEANRRRREHERKVKQAYRDILAPAPDDALSLQESISDGVPPAEPEPIRPRDGIRRVVPPLERVPLRQEQGPPEPPREVLRVPEPEPRPAPRKLHLFEADKRYDEREDELAAIGQGGIP